MRCFMTFEGQDDDFFPFDKSRGEMESLPAADDGPVGLGLQQDALTEKAVAAGQKYGVGQRAARQGVALDCEGAAIGGFAEDGVQGRGAVQGGRQLGEALFARGEVGLQRGQLKPQGTRFGLGTQQFHALALQRSAQLECRGLRVRQLAKAALEGPFKVIALGLKVEDAVAGIGQLHSGTLALLLAAFQLDGKQLCPLNSFGQLGGKAACQLRVELVGAAMAALAQRPAG